MSDKFFLDTNVVVYLYSQDEPEKKAAAVALFEQSIPSLVRKY
jgi:predicted nucleic acid-binding protein